MGVKQSIIKQYLIKVLYVKYGIWNNAKISSRDLRILIPAVGIKENDDNEYEFQYVHIGFNSLRPSDAYMRQQNNHHLFR